MPESELKRIDRPPSEPVNSLALTTSTKSVYPENELKVIVEVPVPLIVVVAIGV